MLQFLNILVVFSHSDLLQRRKLKRFNRLLLNLVATILGSQLHGLGDF